MTPDLLEKPCSHPKVQQLFRILTLNLGLLAQKMEEDCGSVPSSYSAKNKSWLPGLRKKKSGQNSNTM